MTYEALLTIEEVAHLAQVSPETVRTWLEQGLPHTEEHGTIQIQRADLETFLLQQGQGKPRDAATEV